MADVLRGCRRCEIHPQKSQGDTYYVFGVISKQRLQQGIPRPHVTMVGMDMHDSISEFEALVSMPGRN